MLLSRGIRQRTWPAASGCAVGRCRLKHGRLPACSHTRLAISLHGSGGAARAGRSCHSHQSRCCKAQRHLGPRKLQAGRRNRKGGFNGSQCT
jgi:hypothetical protein